MQFKYKLITLAVIGFTWGFTMAALGLSRPVDIAIVLIGSTVGMGMFLLGVNIPGGEKKHIKFTRIDL